MIFTYWKLSIKRKMSHDNTIQRDDLHWTIYSCLSSLYFCCFPQLSLCRESLGGPLQIFKTKQAFHVFLLWSFSSKTHALRHIDRQQESMLWLTSMASGLVHCVWGSTTKSSELSSPDLPYLSSSHLASQAGSTKTLQIDTKQPPFRWH